MKALKKFLLLIPVVAIFVLGTSFFSSPIEPEPAVAPTAENVLPAETPASPEVTALPETTAEPAPSEEPVPSEEPSPTPVPTPTPTPEPEAEELTASLTAGLQGNGASSYLYDNNSNTKCQLNAGSQVWLHSDKPFSSLYLVWYSAPGSYSISGLSGDITTGFLQQYVKLDSPVSDLTLTYNGGMDFLCDIRIFDKGSAPADLPVWQLPSEDCDVLFFPTHADDDCLFMGPMIAESINKGLDVQVSFMCMHPLEPIRELERLQGLWRMGVTHYPTFGGFEDVRTYNKGDAESKFPPSQVLAWQVETIRRFKPEILVGHDLQGEYGNFVHQINADNLMRAFDQAGDGSACPDSAAAWGTWAPQKLYVHLYPENRFDIPLDTPLEAYGGKTAFEVSEAGFSAHISQVQWGYAMVRDPASNQYCAAFGLAKTTVGNDDLSAVDITAHVSFR